MTACCLSRRRLDSVAGQYLHKRAQLYTAMIFQYGACVIYYSSRLSTALHGRHCVVTLGLFTSSIPLYAHCTGSRCCPEAPVTHYQIEIFLRRTEPDKKIFLLVVVRTWNGTKHLPKVSGHGMYTANVSCIQKWILTYFNRLCLASICFANLVQCVRGLTGPTHLDYSIT